jgi:hypothetical protein
MMSFTIISGLLAVTACKVTNLNTVYRDPTTGYTVTTGERRARGASEWIPIYVDRGEPGDVNPAIIEYIFAAPEGPFARYYDLALALKDRPRVVDVDLAELAPEAQVGLGPGARLQGRDYARALGRKLARPIRDAMRFRNVLVGAIPLAGAAGIHWGIPVDLDAGIPLTAYERGNDNEMHVAIFRFESVGLITLYSTATTRVLVWDVSQIHGAFTWSAPLSAAAVNADIVPLHPFEQ